MLGTASLRHQMSKGRLQVFLKHCQCHPISTGVPLVAGHNKWSKVKRQKEVLDPKRSMLFAKIRNQLATAVKLGGGPDPALNSSLAKILEKAKEARMPKASIDRCLNASMEDTGERIMYEVRGKTGYLLLIETMTEPKHRHRTRSELKRILERNSGGMIVEPGSFSFMFDKKCIISATRSGDLMTRDPLEIAIECGAEDLAERDEDQGENALQFLCEIKDHKAVAEAAESLGLSISSTSTNYIPNSSVGLSQEDYDKAVNVVEDLSNHETVLEIYDNFYLDSNS